MENYKTIIFVLWLTDLGASGDGLFAPDAKQIATLVRDCKFVLCRGPKVSDGVDFPFTLDGLDRLIHHQNYNRTFRTVFYVHGLNGERNGSDIKTIHDAYKMRKGFNLILFFWAGPSSDFYPKAVINGVALGKELGKILYGGLVGERLLKLDRTEIVGHSLGAQLAANAGKKIIELGRIHRTGTKLKRLTGLDPAGPFFYFTVPYLLQGNFLDGSQATQTIIIHTDMKVYGRLYSNATVNFLINGGTRIQPGCPRFHSIFPFFSILPFDRFLPFYRYETAAEEMCSHYRSWQFYAEAIIKASSILACSIGDNVISTIGPEILDTMKGKFLVETNHFPPYGRGEDGAICL